MILRAKSSPRHPSPLPGATTATPAVLVPSWLRRAIPDAQSLAGKDVEDVALAAGAAIGALDAVVRRQEKWAGAWRQRLALAAGAVTARQAGRVEDDSQLRDAVLLSRPGDFLSVGPAGLLLLAWRRLAARPAEELLTGKNLGAVLEEFGHAPDDEAVADLAGESRRVSAGAMVGMLKGAFIVAEGCGFGRAVGTWLADALVAQRLGWTHAVPLLGTDGIAGLGASRPRRSGTGIGATNIEDEGLWAKNLLAAQARAALRAIDLSAELGRRSERLQAVAPKLRARASALVVERLLSDDAIVASEKIAGMSDRGLRRLFDRLVELGAVRELSGRPSFRIYGL
ncbi:DUF1403 family protein [Mesorhizobium erdmanii]|uniref:DUF1403 family protein n=1 Tax=Mesorhizobium erdmanii TaxID=1777866 RepID=UPI00047AD7B3|nr:DUF1403 family protein [Mesorhizobium erdmanii]